MKITVVIPTRDRPDTLRQALASVFVQEQSAIKSIVVIDNSDVCDSKQIVDEFNSHLIRYIKNTPVLFDAIERTHQLRSLVDGEYLAILHDDDWWHPGHLAQSLKLLEASPDSALCGSSFLTWTPGKSRMRNEFAAADLLHFLCGFGIEQPYLNCDPSTLTSYCLMGGFFHYSTLLMRRSFLFQLDEILKPDIYCYDTDRLILALAAKHGGAVFSTVPAATVRFHDARDGNHRANEASNIGLRVTQWILDSLEPCQLQEIIKKIELIAMSCVSNPKSDMAKYIVFMSQLLGTHDELINKAPKMAVFLAQQHEKIRIKKSYWRTIASKIIRSFL